MTIGAMIGAVSSGNVADLIGRKGVWNYIKELKFIFATYLCNFPNFACLMEAGNESINCFLYYGMAGSFFC